MTIEALLFTRLSDAAGDLQPLVATRIYPLRFPQDGDFPCVTWQRVTATRENAMGSDPGLVAAILQVDGWAETFDAVRTLADALRERLQRWRAAGPPVVQDCFVDTETDEYDEEAQIYRARFEFRLIYLES